MVAPKSMAVLLTLSVLATTVPPLGVRVMPVGAVGGAVSMVTLVVTVPPVAGLPAASA